MKRSYLINLNRYLPEVNRKSVQQILNCCLRELILDSKYNLGTLVFFLPHLKSKIHVNEVNLNSLSRFNGYGSVLLVPNELTRCVEMIADPVKLLDIIKEELIYWDDQVKLNQLDLELNSHILNAVLGEWHKYETKNGLWHDYNMIPQKLSDYSQKFETFVSSGSPYYPFPKSKVGFSFQDILNYSPEIQPIVPLMLAAIHRPVISITTNIEDFNYKMWFAQHFSEEWSHWVLALNRKGINQEDYLPLPIHPWQFTNYVERIFVDWIENEILVPLEVTIEASPTSSLRTLLPVGNLTAPYIKLPVSVQSTSTLRTSPPQLVKAAITLSQSMAKILANESSISEKLNIMRDDIGLYLNTTEEKIAEHLSVTFRENVVECCLFGKEIAIVIFALFEKPSDTNTILFIHIMRFAGSTTLAGAIQYFTKYVDLVLGGYLDLYLIHGIALEGHQQNTLAVFENGHIKRFIARDLTAVKISAGVSEFDILRGDNIPLPAYCIHNNTFLVRAQILHTVYQLHLGELVILLADHFSCSEKLFWDVISDKTKERFEALKDRVDSVRWRNEYDGILKADWPGVSLLQSNVQDCLTNRNTNRKRLRHFFKNPMN